jgi:hypothetical protein
MKRELFPEERREVARLIAEGNSFWAVATQFPQARQQTLRILWHQVVGLPSAGWVPTEEEMRSLKSEVQSQWDEAQWGQRWVGRFAGAKEDDLQRAASRLIPD